MERVTSLRFRRQLKQTGAWNAKTCDCSLSPGHTGVCAEVMNQKACLIGQLPPVMPSWGVPVPYSAPGSHD
eukprot:1151315-Pelagomonas_calceolata.AAC.1